MTAPLIAFLCGNPEPPSRSRFQTAVHQVGARFAWLDPHDEISVVPDVAIARNGGFTSERALSTLRTLESLGTVCISAPDAVARASDKLATYHALTSAGVPTPVTAPLAAAAGGRLPDGFPDAYPVVVKARRGMRGEGVFLVRDARELDAAARKLGGDGLVQRFIAGGEGSDVRVIVVGGSVLGAIRRTAAPGDFRANAHQGASVAPQPLDDHLAGVALRATSAVGLDIAGVDLIRDDDAWTVIEVNSSPGFEAFEAATGVDVAVAIVRLALSRAGAVA